MSGLECLAVVAAAPFLLFPAVYPLGTAALLVALAAVWLLCLLALREPWPATPFNGALLLLALGVVVGILTSVVPELTLPKATGLVLGLAAFRAAALGIRDRRALNLALVLFFALGGGIAAVGVLGTGWTEKVGALAALGQRIPRLISSLPGLGADAINPNQLAGALTLYLPLAAALVAAALARRRPLASWPLLVGGGLALLVTAGVLLLTQSRGGWIGGAAGLLALASAWLLTDRRRWVRPLGGALPLLALLAGLVALLLLGPERIGETLYRSLDTAAGTVSLRGRIEIWSRALYAIHDFPLTGCGLGAFRRVVHVLYPLFLVPPDHDVAHAHNVFLQTALDLGLPGLVGYLALLLSAGASCWRCARRGGPLARPLALGLGAGLVGLHVYGLVDALAMGSKPGLAFWLALGLIAALERINAEAVP